jgi:hypothetical protein
MAITPGAITSTADLPFRGIEVDRLVTSHAIDDVAGKTYVGGTFYNYRKTEGGNLTKYIGRFNASGAVTPFVSINHDFITNGRIYDVYNDGSYYYIAGSFSWVNGHEVSGLAKISHSGVVQTSWNPNVSGTVRWIIGYGSSIFFGGSFTSVGGVTRTNLASVSASSGALSSWNPVLDHNYGVSGAAAYGAVLSGSTLYVVGKFTSVNGSQRLRGAAFTVSSSNPSSVTLLSWDPRISTQDTSNFEAYCITILNNVLYIGGYFAEVNGQTRVGAAAVSTSGTLQSWNPNFRDSPETQGVGTIYSIQTDGTHIYAAGGFTVCTASTGGTVTRYGLSKQSVSGSGGDVNMGISFNDYDTNPPVFFWGFTDMQILNGILYLSSYEIETVTILGIGTYNRSGSLGFNLSTGQLTDWNPTLDEYGTISKLVPISGTSDFIAVGGFLLANGTPSLGLLVLDRDGEVSSTQYQLSTDGSIYCMEIDEQNRILYVGGSFSSINGVAATNLGAINLETNQVITSIPGPNSLVQNIKIADSFVYFCGNFTSVNGSSRGRLARLSRSTRALDSWDPNLNNTCYAVDTDSSYVYAAGYFTSASGSTRNKIARYSHNGTLNSWYPTGGANGNLFAITVNSNYAYVSGYFTTIGGVSKTSMAAISISTGAVATGFTANTDGNVIFSLDSSDTIVAGYGSFAQINSQNVNCGVALNADTGSVIAQLVPDENATYIFISGRDTVRIKDDKTITISLMSSLQRYALVTGINTETMSARNGRE